MPRKTKENTKQAQWLRLEGQLKRELPQLFAVMTDEADFIELRLKTRPDGTVLGILKRYDADGGPTVCFGAGYGVVPTLMALDATVASNSWRVDKPWKPAG